MRHETLLERQWRVVLESFGGDQQRALKNWRTVKKCDPPSLPFLEQPGVTVGIDLGIPGGDRTVIAVIEPIREIRGVRKRRQLERIEQVALFTWADASLHKYPELEDLFHIPNSGGYSGGHKKNRMRVIRMLEEGVRPGILDIQLPHARGAFIGWWAEMKAGKNELSENQKYRAERLHRAGHAVTAHWSFESARNSLIAYLERGERIGLPDFLRRE